MVQRLLVLFSAVALGLAWLMPNHYPPWTSFHGELMAFIAAVGLFVATQCVAPSNDTRVSWPLPTVLLGLTVVMAAQASFKQIYSGEAVVGACYVLGALSIVYCGAYFRSNFLSRPALEVFAWCVVLAVILSVYIALLQHFQLEEILGIFAVNLAPGARPYANLAQPNHLSTLVVMGLLAVAYLYASAAFGRVVFWLLGTFVIIGITISQSRTAYISIAVVGCYLLFVARKNKQIQARWVYVAWASSIGWTIVWRYVIGTDARPLENIHRDDARITLWKQAISAIENSPLLGYGFHQTHFAQSFGAVRYPADMPTDYFHNIILDAMVWFGLPLGLLASAVIIGHLLIRAKNQSDLEGTFCVALTVPIAMHSLLEFPFAYAYFLFPLALLLGLMQDQSNGKTFIASQRNLWILNIIWMILGLLILRDYLIVEDQYRTMRFELRKIGARNERFEYKSLPTLNQFEDLFWASRIDTRLERTSSELQRFKKIATNTTWATLQVRYAASLANNGNCAEAIVILKKIQNIYGSRTYQEARLLFSELTSCEMVQTLNVNNQS